jgi:hypothetical protein
VLSGGTAASICVKEWLRNCTVHPFLDLLCWAVPQGQRFELIIEPEDENTMVVVAA